MAYIGQGLLRDGLVQDSLALGGMCHPCGAEVVDSAHNTALRNIRHQRAMLGAFPFVYDCRTTHVLPKEKKKKKKSQMGF